MPRPRNLRNAWFVDKVSDRRLIESILYGVQGTAMPSWIDYGLTQDRRGRHVEFHSQHQSEEVQIARTSRSMAQR